MLRVVRNVSISRSGAVRRLDSKRKVFASKNVPGFLVNGGSGGRRAGRTQSGSGKVGEQAEPNLDLVRKEVAGRFMDVSRTISRPGGQGRVRSFAEVTACPKVLSVREMRANRRQLGSKDGRPAVCFSQEEIKAGEKKFQFALVLKFASGRPSARELQRWIATKWNLIGGFSFCEMWDSSHVICILQSEVDVKSALRSSHCRVGKSVFQVVRWSADFDPNKKSADLAVWIRFPGIPLYLYDKTFAETMVSGFASFIGLDECSTFLKCLNHLRVRVKVNGECSIPDKVWVELPNNKGYWQEIVVEGVFCSYCRLIGHREESCEKQKLAAKGKSVDVVQENPDEHREASEWPVVSRVKISNGAKDDTSAEGDDAVGGMSFDPREEPKWEVVSHRKSVGGISHVISSLNHSKDSFEREKEGAHASSGVGQCAILEAYTSGDMQGQSHRLMDMSKPNSQPNAFVTSHSIQSGPAAPCDSLVCSRKKNYNKEENVTSSTKKPTCHVSPSMAHSKVGFEKEVGSNSPLSPTFDVVIPRRKKNKKKKVGSKDNYESLVGHDLESDVPSIHVTTHGRLSREHTSHDSLEKALGPTSHDIIGHVTPMDISHVNTRHGSIASCDSSFPFNAAAGVSPCESSGGSLGPPVGQLNVAEKGTKSPPMSSEKAECVMLAAVPPSDSTGLKHFPSDVSPSCNVGAQACDSLDLLRKKMGHHKLDHAKEGQNERISAVPMSLPEDKIASYGNKIVCYDDEDFAPLDAMSVYLRLKSRFNDDADIFHTMDQMYGTASHVQNDSPSEASDGSIDLSRILKHPRQKTKGSRTSGRFGPKKKGSKVDY